MKDGWHTIAGYKVYVEGNYILRGIDAGRTVYCYRWSNRLGCWTSDSKVTPDALRAGVRRDTIKMA